MSLPQKRDGQANWRSGEKRDAARDPRTREEWQEAVDLAEAWLRIDAAKQYGLVAGGPTIDVDRCQTILEQGNVRGFVPNEAHVEHCVLAIAESGQENAG